MPVASVVRTHATPCFASSAVHDAFVLCSPSRVASRSARLCVPSAWRIKWTSLDLAHPMLEYELTGRSSSAASHGPADIVAASSNSAAVGFAAAANPTLSLIHI